jgi:hypothetical protein
MSAGVVSGRVSGMVVHPFSRVRPAARWIPASAVAAWSLLLSVVTAWKVGSMDADPSTRSALPLRRVFEPVVSGTAERVVCAAGVAAFVAVSVVIFILAVRGRLNWQWLTVMAPAVAVAVPLGWGYRVATAAQPGPNIGEPIVFVVCVWTALTGLLVIRRAVTVHRRLHPIVQ